MAVDLIVYPRPIEYVSKKIEIFKTRTESASLRRYYLRGWDSGTGGWVYWGPVATPAEQLAPHPAQTTPSYTGTLSQAHVWLIK